MRTFLASALLALVGTSAFAADTSRYDDIFRKYTKRFFGPGFDWRVFKAQGLAESNLNPEARSWVGATGIMQLMPSTFAEVQSKNPELEDVNQPEWNIAAGIFYDRQLWKVWKEHDSIQHRLSFMLASYNAGRGTINRAKNRAVEEKLDDRTWPSIETVAPRVPRWRYAETLTYVKRIESFYNKLAGVTDGFLGIPGVEPAAPAAAPPPAANDHPPE
jgi:membrane-bound lytic murein transglycosylase F